MATGIRKRHARSCRSKEGGSCNCTPSVEAWVWSNRDGQKIRRTFTGGGADAAAKGWRTDALAALRRGTMAAPTRQTVEEAARAWLAGAKAGEILTPSGTRYKPSVLRTYDGDLDRYVLPELGSTRLSNLQRRDVQRLVDRLVGLGLSGSKVRNAIMPLRAVIRRALRKDELTVNPTANLELPATTGTRDRVATAEEAAALLAALPEQDRPLWAAAFYAGLRRGELRALRWDDVDEAVTVIRVRHGWDDVEGEIDPKSRKGERRVPVTSGLRLLLLEHKARTGRRGDELMFGCTGTTPFTPPTLALGLGLGRPGR